MQKPKLSVQELTDEDVLKEFVRRFDCDGAVLIYLDKSNEFGFGRWCNGTGKTWVKDVLKAVKQNVYLHVDETKLEDRIALPL